MPAKNKIKKEIKRIKTWLHSVDALSRPAGGGACQERRSSRWWSSWRRSCRIHSVLRGKVGGGGSPSRPVPPPIHVSLICFPVSAASPLTSPSRVRGGVWLLVGRGRHAWPWWWWWWWWCSAAWVQQVTTRWYHTLLQGNTKIKQQ